MFPGTGRLRVLRVVHTIDRHENDACILQAELHPALMTVPDEDGCGQLVDIEMVSV